MRPNCTLMRRFWQAQISDCQWRSISGQVKRIWDATVQFFRGEAAQHEPPLALNA
ncbi:hypothetical protein GQ53DRAFT_746611 [Thozetella sp. PMI_491]|nr:hypothetical protein GQ53DRAFT_746611 [Thozetella sp. PMI_491]